jgi:RNA polymerase sigma-70 factor (ECF subfamily)
METQNDRPDRDARWAEGLRAGDDEIFEELFRTLYSDLVAYAQTIVARADIAEGVVQEAFLRLWKQRTDWEAGDHVTAYVYRTVHNRALNASRDKKTQNEHHAELSADDFRAYVSPDQELHGADLRDAIEEAIDELPARRRQIFLLSRRHNLTYAQIAEVLDISERTVETQIRRSLQALRECASKYR